MERTTLAVETMSQILAGPADVIVGRASLAPGASMERAWLEGPHLVAIPLEGRAGTNADATDARLSLGGAGSVSSSAGAILLNDDHLVLTNDGTQRTDALIVAIIPRD
jgi:hypothetical protein